MEEMEQIYCISLAQSAPHTHADTHARMYEIGESDAETPAGKSPETRGTLAENCAASHNMMTCERWNQGCAAGLITLSRRSRR